MSTFRRYFEQHGQNTDVDAAADELVASNGAAPFPAAAAATNLISTSTADDPGQTGLFSVRVHYLDSAYAYQTEDVTLDGTTQVLMTGQVLRVLYLEPLTAGSAGVNVGAINVRHTTTVIASMAARAARLTAAVFTVPADAQARLTYFYGDTELPDAGSELVLRLQIRKPTEVGAAGTAWETVDTVRLAGEGTAATDNNAYAQYRRLYSAIHALQTTLPARSDVRVVADADTDNTATRATFGVELR